MLYVSSWLWAATLLWFIVLLTADLYLYRKSTRADTLKRAVWRSVFWVSMGVLLGILIWFVLGSEAGAQYFYGFVVEKSLSVDNIFVWGVVLTYLNIPKNLHHTVLFWGVLGAIISRTIFVVGGTELVNNFEGLPIILGAMLLYTAFRLGRTSSRGFKIENSKQLKFLERILPLSDEIHGHKLFIKKHGRRLATLLFLAICMVEITDIFFAVDSVPAVLAVVRSPYIALSSNIAALLGLHALYFVFEDIQGLFWLLNKGLALILATIGGSLLLEPHTIFGMQWFDIDVPTSMSLTFVLTVLTLSILGSLLIKKPHKKSVS